MTPSTSVIDTKPVAAVLLEAVQSLPKLYNYLQGKGMSQSYMGTSDLRIVNNEMKRSHIARKTDVSNKTNVPGQQWKPASPTKPLAQPPLPSAVPPLASTSRGPKSLMSLPLPQTSNDNDDLISYSPTSPISPPLSSTTSTISTTTSTISTTTTKSTKKGIMDLPLPPGWFL